MDKIDISQYRTQAARGEAVPRRYTGRGAASRGHIGPAAQTVPPTRQAVSITAGIASHQIVSWSLRLLVAVSLVLALLVGLRLPGLLTLPIDPPSGVQATHAAFAHMLAGQVANSIDAVRFYPVPSPWYGSAPVNPVSGLPVYGWLVAAAMMVLGAGDWIGRAVAMMFSLTASLLLFNTVRRAAGARAALYSLLFFSFAPLSVVLGQQFSPASTILAFQTLAVLALVRWRLSHVGQPTGSSLSYWLAMAAGITAALVDPGAIFLIILAAYLMLAPDLDASQTKGDRASLAPRDEGSLRGPKEIWQTSPNKGKLIGYACALLASTAIWQLMTSGDPGGLVVAGGDGGINLSATIGSLLNGGTYAVMIGLVMEKVLTIFGALLLLAGLLRGARRPVALLFHAWVLAGLAHVLWDASRIGRHDDVLMPLLLPVCALAGLGAAWAGALPARIWLAITEQTKESETDYHVSPHTSWLLDLPEETAVRTLPKHRPQAQVALGKSVALRARQAGAQARRAWVMGIGNFLVLLAFATAIVMSWTTTQSRMQASAAAIELREIGRDVRAATADGSRLIVAGPSAPELFYASARTGWAVSMADFSIAKTQELQRQGAAYLLSTDQDALGHHPDYIGLLTNYSVAKLGHGYILFDLSTRPAANDRRYFLESGHTLGGNFRRFWEQNGDLNKLGYPISEELDEVNQLDGQTRTVQYFERAVLEYHPENAGTPDVVMLAAVGRWVTRGRDLPGVAPFKSTPDRAYFAETGHSVKEAFLRYWQREGGLAKFGYPISEELPEISSGDGKVYTVQYFERARLEWHPTFAGTSSEVQLGLIGKQAWEMKK